MRKDVLYPGITFALITVALILVSTIHNQQARERERVYFQTEQRKTEEIAAQKRMEEALISLLDADSPTATTAAQVAKQPNTMVTEPSSSVAVTTPPPPTPTPEPPENNAVALTEQIRAQQLAEELAQAKAEQAEADRLAAEQAAAKEAARLAAEKAAAEAARLAAEEAAAKKASRSSRAS